jgi:hypothetical protein
MMKEIKQRLSIQMAQRFKPQDRNGQSLVELAIAAPLLIFLMLGLFEVGAAIRSYVVMVNVNREITRFAVRPGYLDFATQADVVTSYQKVRDWVDTSLGDQLKLDFDNGSGDTTLIVSHVVADTGLPCQDIITNPDGCDCNKFDPDHPDYDPDYANSFTIDDLIIHPGMSSYEFQAQRFGPTTTVTGARDTRIDYAAVAAELAAKNNAFNCEILKKGGVASANNAIITELFHDQAQLFGFPFISNPLTDPYPLYTHTSMRLTCAARSNGSNPGNLACGVDTYGAGCMAYPITFHQDIFGDPDHPAVPQNIDAYEGDSPGNFGWLTWNSDQDNNNANYVEDELAYPQMSITDFTDVNDPDDHELSLGDDVSTKPGVANSDGVDEQLQALLDEDYIIVPVYDNNPGNGEGAYYHISHFAKIKVNEICLPRNGQQCDGENDKQIKATFLGYVDDLCGG